jgi:protein gp37
MAKSSIEWTEETWNPLKGCRRISPGCGGANNEGGCYAERQGIRFAGPDGAYEGLVKSTPKGPRWTGAAAVDEAKLLEPLSWRKPRTVFVDSMSDLFFEGFTDETIAHVMAVMAVTPEHTYQVLTKRAARMESLLSSRSFRDLVERWAETPRASALRPPGTGWRSSIGWPLPNVWWGVSCEDRKHGLPRLEHLRRTPAAVRTVSLEPLLEDLGRVDFAGIHWAIVGGESGPRSRPFHLDWGRSLIAQARAGGAAPFFKQAGSVAMGTGADVDAVLTHQGKPGSGCPPGPWRLPLKHKKGADLSELPEDLRVREMPEVPRAS